MIGHRKDLPDAVRQRLTLDNWRENARDREITEPIGRACYFAHPYATWERATNKQVLKRSKVHSAGHLPEFSLYARFFQLQFHPSQGRILSLQGTDVGLHNLPDH